MIILEGKYGEAKIATDYVEPSAISQITELLNTPIAENAHIRIMPDVHAGRGCVIGTSMYITDKVVPNLVGVDIGCGVNSQYMKIRGEFLGELDDIICKHVPHGASIHLESPFTKCDSSVSAKHTIELLNDIIAPINKEYAFHSIGSLGGGNHFIELNQIPDNHDEYILIIHSGSRNLGVEVASYYQNKAIEHCEQKGYKIPKDLSFLEGNDMKNYIHDMELLQRYAVYNRMIISDLIYQQMMKRNIDVETNETFNLIVRHNYIETDSGNTILRKGAVSAYENQFIFIPLNMKDGVIFCKGKGNPEWNYTAPHGAGRLYSRRAAKSELSMEDFKEDMKGIYTSCIKKSTLDECPRAYKDMKDIIKNIEPMVDVLEILTPVYNFKA